MARVTADDIPTSVTQLVYTDPGGDGMSQNQLAQMLAHYWPAIEQHIREKVAADLEQRIHTWPGMSALAVASNETLAQAARIARAGL